MKKVTLAGIMVICLMMLGPFTANSVRAETYQLKYASALLATSGGNLVCKWWIDELEKRTKGRVKIQYIPDGALIKAGEMLEAIRSGTIDVNDFVPVYFQGQFPLTSMISALHLFSGHEQATRLGNQLMFDEGPISAAFQEEFRKHNMIPIFVIGELPATVWSKNPIKTLADFKDLKVRTTGRYQPKVFEHFGAVPVNIKPSEWYEGLARGIVGAIAIPHTYSVPYNLMDVAKYESFSLGSICGVVPAMNLDSFNKLPSDIREIILQLNKDTVNQAITIYSNQEEVFLKKMKDAGMTIIDVPKDEQNMIHSQWIKLLTEEWAAKDMPAVGEGDIAKQASDRVLELLGVKR